MNKTVVYLICQNRILIGTFKNAFRSFASVHILKVNEVLHFCNSSFEATPPLFSDIAASSNSDLINSSDLSQDEIKNVKSKVADFLKGTVNESLSISTELSPSIPPPDLIIYNFTGDIEKDSSSIHRIRLSCQFNDISIVITCAHSESISARLLLSAGADEIFITPINTSKFIDFMNRLTQPAGTKTPMIAKLINPYIGATVDLLSTMANLSVKRRSLFLKKNYRLFGDISGIMNFSGKIEGSLAICFDRTIATTIISTIMACKPNELSEEELKEGVGELVNIISGNAKASFAGSDFSHNITLPAVVSGFNHQITHPRNTPCITVIFEVEKRPFAIMVTMAPKFETEVLFANGR